jgi:4-azaleucine resistance transporter AzlC
VVNARHIAYGLTLRRRINAAGSYKPYLIYGLTDETFALHTAAPEGSPRFMFLTAILDESYWFLGNLLGALAGSLIPFDFSGADFALTALFIVLCIEQFLKIRKLKPFLITAAITLAATLFLPSRVALLISIIASLAAVQAFSGKELGASNDVTTEAKKAKEGTASC